MRGLVRQPTGASLVQDCAGEYGFGQSTDITLPPRPAEWVGHVCSIIVSGAHYTEPIFIGSSVTDVETCFWQAYQSCTRPVSLVFEPDGTLTKQTFVVQPTPAQASRPASGACALTETITTVPFGSSSPTRTSVACVSLSRNTDGSLVVHDCGAVRQILIPAWPPESDAPSQ